MVTSKTRPDALNLLLDAPTAESEPEALIASAIDCARVLHTTSDYIGAVDLLAKLRGRLGQHLSQRDEIAVGFTLIRALLQLQRFSEASLEIALLRDSFAKTDPSALVEEKALLAAFEGGLLWRRGRWQEATQRLELVRARLIARPDGLASAIALLELHCALMWGGSEARARVLIREAVVAAARYGGEYELAIANLHLAKSERRHCRWAAAREALEPAITSFVAIGNGRFLRDALRCRAITDWKQGRLASAEQGFGQCVVDPDSSGFVPDDTCALMGVALVKTHRGEFDAARDVLHEVTARFVPKALTRMSILASQYLGELELERGEFAIALPLLQATLVRAVAHSPESELFPELGLRIAECQLSIDPDTDQTAAVQQALCLIQARGDLYIESWAYRVLALAHMRRGQQAKAREAFEAGFALFDETGTPYEWAKLWMAYGDWLASESAAAYRNDSAAVEAYRAAMDHFERIGAEYKLGEARQRLEALEARMKSEGEAYAPTTAKVRPSRRPRLSAELLRRSQWALDTFGTVTRNAHLLGMLEELGSVAVSDLPVLVLGESGTGKELVARGVHNLSGRTGEFLAINCSAVPEQMLEGEFFGYMRGAFTNALADKPGLFEVAHEGTVFLDEIGEMSLDLQSKMLRFLESGVLRRVGATRDTHVETRIVAATNRERSNLQGGTGFRSDLYYRLAHAVYELPPLRERGDDVELLLDHFLEYFSRQNDRVVRLAPAVRTRLLAHGWPGNVRELRSVVNKVVVSARPDGIVTPRELPLLEESAAPTNFLAERSAEEKKRVLRALEQADYVKTDAARVLRISRTTLLGMMKRLGIEG